MCIWKPSEKELSVRFAMPLLTCVSRECSVWSLTCVAMGVALWMNV